MRDFENKREQMQLESLKQQMEDLKRDHELKSPENEMEQEQQKVANVRVINLSLLQQQDMEKRGVPKLELTTIMSDRLIPNIVMQYNIR